MPTPITAAALTVRVRPKKVRGYVPEVDDALPPSRPATLIRIPADAFKSKDALRAALRGETYAPATPNQPKLTALGTTLSAAAAHAAGSDGAALKPMRRSRAEAKLEAQVEEANVPQFKPLVPVRTTRAGRPVKTYAKFHHN